MSRASLSRLVLLLLGALFEIQEDALPFWIDVTGHDDTVEQVAILVHTLPKLGDLYFPYDQHGHPCYDTTDLRASDGDPPHPHTLTPLHPHTLSPSHPHTLTLTFTLTLTLIPSPSSPHPQG